MNLYFAESSYVHIPDAVQFTSKLDDIYIVCNDLQKLSGIFHNDKIIFYKDKVDVILYKQRISFSYFDLIKWRSVPEKSEFILFLDNLKITIYCGNNYLMNEILKTLDTIIKDIISELQI